MFTKRGVSGARIINLLAMDAQAVGSEVTDEQIETFLECQMCRNNDYLFRRCSDLLSGSIFCQSMLDTSQSQITEHLITSQGGYSASTIIPNSSVSQKLFVSTSTTGNYDKDQLSVTNESDASDDLVLKISLPVTVGFITLLVCVVGVVIYKRRGNETKTDRTTKAEVKSIPEKQVYSELDFSESNSSFALENCYQKISKGSYSLNASPYNNTEAVVNNTLRDKQVRQTEGNSIYQISSTDLTGDMSGYDTIANANNNNQEEEATYNHLHHDANDTY